MIRQGDLLFVPIELSTETEVQWDDSHDGVIAEGEATGHRHEIDPEDMKHVRIGFMDGPRRMVIDAIEAIRVVHPEHATVVLRAPHKVVRQREWVEGVARNVID